MMDEIFNRMHPNAANETVEMYFIEFRSMYVYID